MVSNYSRVTWIDRLIASDYRHVMSSRPYASSLSFHSTATMTLELDCDLETVLEEVTRYHHNYAYPHLENLLKVDRKVNLRASISFDWAGDTYTLPINKVSKKVLLGSYECIDKDNNEESLAFNQFIDNAEACVASVVVKARRNKEKFRASQKRAQYKAKLKAVTDDQSDDDSSKSDHVQIGGGAGVGSPKIDDTLYAQFLAFQKFQQQQSSVPTLTATNDKDSDEPGTICVLGSLLVVPQHCVLCCSHNTVYYVADRKRRREETTQSSGFFGFGASASKKETTSADNQ